MMSHNIRLKGLIWKIIPKLSLVPLLIWSSTKLFKGWPPLRWEAKTWISYAPLYKEIFNHKTVDLFYQWQFQISLQMRQFWIQLSHNWLYTLCIMLKVLTTTACKQKTLQKFTQPSPPSPKPLLSIFQTSEKQYLCFTPVPRDNQRDWQKQTQLKSKGGNVV